MTVPRPASEHAREKMRGRAEAALDGCTMAYDGRVKPLARDILDLLSALAVVEQERDQLDDALAAQVTERAE